MTRREFLSAASATSQRAPRPVVVPLRQVFDRRALYMHRQMDAFRIGIWPEATRNFAKCGVVFLSTTAGGEIRRSPSDTPMFTGLHRGALNLVVTDLVPMAWDRGRGLAGITTAYEGFHLCVIALEYAHCNLIPFVSVNTCVHEILHALMLDIFEARPAGLAGEAREVRIDGYATRLWLFGDGASVRRSAGLYVRRLESAASGGI